MAATDGKLYGKGIDQHLRVYIKGDPYSLTVMGDKAYTTFTNVRILEDLIVEGVLSAANIAFENIEVDDLTVTGDLDVAGDSTVDGDFTVNGDFDFVPGLQFAVQRKATAVDTDTDGYAIIGVTDTTGLRTITLLSVDALVDGYKVIVMDESAGASANNITVTTEGTETINGSTDDATIMVDSGVLRLYADGANWFAW